MYDLRRKPLCLAFLIQFARTFDGVKKSNLLNSFCSFPGSLFLHIVYVLRGLRCRQLIAAALPLAAATAGKKLGKKTEKRAKKRDRRIRRSWARSKRRERERRRSTPAGPKDGTVSHIFFK
jgi:hypothetical protein